MTTADHDALYRGLDPTERAERRAVMVGKGWTDPRDFGGKLGSMYLECPLIGIARKDYCWERCPADEPVSECPRRQADSNWWWAGGGDAPDAPDTLKLIATPDITMATVEDTAEPAAVEADDEVNEPEVAPSSAEPPTTTTRKRRKTPATQPEPSGDMDVFDLFG